MDGCVGRERRDTVHERRENNRKEKAKRVSACVSPPEFESEEIDVSRGWAGIISGTKQKRKSRVNGTAARSGDPDNAEIDMLHSMMREERKKNNLFLVEQMKQEKIEKAA